MEQSTAQHRVITRSSYSLNNAVRYLKFFIKAIKTDSDYFISQREFATQQIGGKIRDLKFMSHRANEALLWLMQENLKPITDAMPAIAEELKLSNELFIRFRGKIKFEPILGNNENDTGLKICYKFYKKNLDEISNITIIDEQTGIVAETVVKEKEKWKSEFLGWLQNPNRGLILRLADINLTPEDQNWILDQLENIKDLIEDKIITRNMVVIQRKQI